jgi:hypothetical protein
MLVQGTFNFTSVTVVTFDCTPRHSRDKRVHPQRASVIDSSYLEYVILQLSTYRSISLEATTADNAGTEEYEQVYKYRPAAQLVAHYCAKREEVDIM